MYILTYPLIRFENNEYLLEVKEIDRIKNGEIFLKNNYKIPNSILEYSGKLGD